MTKQKAGWLLAAGAIGLAAAAAGCGSSDDSADTGTHTVAAKTADQAPRKAANVAFLVNAYTDFVQVQEQGIKDAVQPGGGSVKVLNPNFDPQAQLKQCQDAIASQRYNVIILDTIEHATGVPCVQAAKAAGIPVVTLDLTVGSDADSIEPTVDGVAASAVLSPASNAANVVEMTKKACEGHDPRQIITELVTPNDSYTQTTLDAITKEVPNAKIVGRLATGFDPSVMVDKIPDLLTANPDTDVIVTVADSSGVAILPMLKDRGLNKRIKVIGNGGSRAGVKAVADGTMYSTTAQRPKQEGSIVGRWAAELASGQTPHPNAVDVLKLGEPHVIYQDNADQFTPEWGAQ